MATTYTLLYLNDNLLQVKGLKDALTGALIDTATVTVTLKDLAGNAVAGAAWPLTLMAAGGGTGDYSVTIPDDIQVSAGDLYTAEIVADDGPGRRAVWKVPVQMLIRRS